MYLADTLSRSVTGKSKQSAFGKEEIFQTEFEQELENTHMASHIAVSQERLTEFQLATREDPDMRRLTQVIQAGWPENRGDLPLNLQSYFSFREELSVQNGLIFKGERIVVPNTEGLRSKVCGLLHKSHTGVQ